jgi:DNA mismatch repair protein MutS2
VVTTHFERVRQIAVQEPERWTNAAVTLDAGQRPTFTLAHGVPGRSSAFGVARRIGLPEHVIARAEAMAHTVRERDVEAREAEVAAAQEALAAEREILRAEQAELAREQARLSARDRRELEAAQSRQAKAHVEATLELNRLEEDLKRLRKRVARGEGEAQEVRADARREIGAARERLAEHRPAAPQPEGRAPDELRPGDRVDVPSWSAAGEVVSVRGDRVVVQLPRARVTVERAALRPARAVPTPAARPRPSPVRDASEARRHFGAHAQEVDLRIDNVADLRGQRADEVITMLEVFLDRAVAEDREVVVLRHGYGSGALRQVVREHLPRLRHVQAHRPGLPSEGGDAVTVVWVKG